jgi:hypothetical protein
MTTMRTNHRAQPGSTVMSRTKLVSVDHPEAPAIEVSARLRSQLVYFMTMADAPGVPVLGESEFWIARDDVARWLEEGVFRLVSPLDTENMTEVELTEEQETLLNWLDRNQIQHVRVVG